MKKIIVLVTALLVCFVVTAQNKKVVRDYKSAFSFNVGLSKPLGDFNSTNANNENAGFAKTGFNVNVNYDYKFVENFGLAANFMYGYHNLHKDILHQIDPGLDMNHYQFVAGMIGPMVRASITPKTDFDFRILGGVGRANSPEFVFQGETIITEDWASSFAWKMDADVRFNMSNTTFFMLNVGYTQMRPKFDVKETGTNTSTKQELHISVINLNAGVGIKF